MKELITKKEDLFMDYEVLEDIGCLKGREIIVYGAGHFGSRASEMLQELGFSEHRFCDRDVSKQGTDYMGRKVLSVSEVEKMENLLIIVAIADGSVRRTVEQNLAGIPGARLLSFFALERAWKYTAFDPAEPRAMADALHHRHEVLSLGMGRIVRAWRSPVLVYQYGKVGSSTVQRSLVEAGIRSCHIHRFFEKTPWGIAVMPDDGQRYFRQIPYLSSPEYENCIRQEMRGRKIITMVRDPIVVNLSRIFEDLGNGRSDWHFTKQMWQGDSFQQTVEKLMLKFKDCLFRWFDEELKELCGIDVFVHPFDREKGYAIIRENGVEVLLMKTEKLSGLAEVIGDFVGLPHFELVDANVGGEKEYAHIYRKTKENLVLPKEYVDFYYEGNPRMDHFYSEAEREALKRKWRTS